MQVLSQFQPTEKDSEKMTDNANAEQQAGSDTPQAAASATKKKSAKTPPGASNHAPSYWRRRHERAARVNFWLALVLAFIAGAFATHMGLWEFLLEYLQRSFA